MTPSRLVATTLSRTRSTRCLHWKPLPIYCHCGTRELELNVVGPRSQGPTRKSPPLATGRVRTVHRSQRAHTQMEAIPPRSCHSSLSRESSPPSSSIKIHVRSPPHASQSQILLHPLHVPSHLQRGPRLSVREHRACSTVHPNGRYCMESRLQNSSFLPAHRISVAAIDLEAEITATVSMLYGSVC